MCLQLCGMRENLSIQEATKIAEAYCAKVNENRHAKYSGIFSGGYLFCFDFQKSGHRGILIFVIVKQSGAVEKIEAHSDLFYNAWDASDAYFESLKAL